MKSNHKQESNDSLNQQSGETSYDFDDSSDSLNQRMNLPDNSGDDIIRIPSFRNAKQELSSDSSEVNPSDSEDEELEDDEEEENVEAKSSDSSEIIVPSKLIEVSKFHRGITKK